MSHILGGVGGFELTALSSCPSSILNALRSSTIYKLSSRNDPATVKSYIQDTANRGAQIRQFPSGHTYILDVRSTMDNPIWVQIPNKNEIGFNDVTHISPWMRRLVWYYSFGFDQVGTCRICGRLMSRSRQHAYRFSGLYYHCSHLKSRKHGGPIAVGNLIPACNKCNQKIGPTDIIFVHRPYQH